MTRTNRSRKSIAAAAAFAGAGILTGVGAFAAFSDTETATRSVDAGQLDIAVTPASVAINDLAPGDIWSSQMTIELPADGNDGDLIEYIRFEAAPGAGEVLGQEIDNGVPVGPQSSLFSDDEGLRVVIQSCDDAAGWTSNGDGTFSCAGDVTDVAGDAGNAAITSTDDIVYAVKLDEFTGNAYEFGAADFGVSPTDTGTIPDGSKLDLLVTFALPGDNLFGATAPAGNSYENAALPNLTFDLTAIQRAGIER